MHNELVMKEKAILKLQKENTKFENVKIIDFSKHKTIFCC